MLVTLFRSTRIAAALGAMGLLFGCAPPESPDAANQSGPHAAVSSTNGLTQINGLRSTNGLYAVNGFHIVNGLASIAGLSETEGLMTTDAGRQTVRYLIRCAIPAGHAIVKRDQYGTAYTFQGQIGLAPQWEGGGCWNDCQHWVSACLLAHVNTAGQNIPLWLAGAHAAIGWGRSALYPNQEGTFFGNIFTFENGIDQQGQRVIEAYYCNGPGFSRDVVPGRLGDTGAEGEPYINAYGQTNYLCSDSGACTPADVPNSRDGYKQCSALRPSGLRQWTTAYNETITVWRQALSTSALATGGTGGAAGAGGAGGAGATTATATGGVGGSAAPAGVLLFDDFEDGNSAGWTTRNGSWSVVSDGSKVLKQSGSSSWASASSGSTNWVDQSVEGRVRILQLGGTTSGYRVEVHARASGSAFYALALRGDGQLELRRGSTRLGGTVGASVSPGSWHVLKIVAHGPASNVALEGYLDGALKLRASDTAGLAAGSAGVGTAGTNTQAEFDDVRVTTP